MKRFLMSLAVAFCCAGAISTAVADGPRRYDDRGSYSHRAHKHHYQQKHKHKHVHKHHRHHESRRGRPGPLPHAHHFRRPPPHAARHHHRWERGARLPAHYRTRHYIVHDWHARKFRRPPQGYHWVNVGADYFLVGIATGVILQSVFGR